ncbi:MAG TPA: hypothetical protein VH988_17255 [Thermoanaerobaculia bacterium]|jgi:hypothetical protein|nr:hypothetical protein [Thermoanaerobaculia bacterium]
MSSDPRRLTQGFLAAGLLAAALATLASLGCGKQGPPLPPLRSVPAPTRDLVLRQQGTNVLFELTYPKTSASGQALDGIKAVEVYEAVQPAPATGKPQPLEVKVFSPIAKKVFQVTDADVGASTFGDRLIFSMPLPAGAMTPVAPPAPKTPPKPPAKPPAPGTMPPTPATPPAAPAPPPEPRPAARFYAVRTISKNGEKSDFSNQVSLIPKNPPPGPDQVSTTARPDGVLVEWSPVPGALGYAVYRRNAQEKGHGQPVHPAGASEKSWLDNTAHFGQSYIYSVTSFNDRDPFIESAFASEREIHYLDRFPPPPPTELVGLGETGRIRLVWRASEADDLAGYIVYRRGPQGEFKRITAQALTAAEYVDTDVKAGETYSYRVTAIDQTGNESAPGGEVRVTLP